MKKIISALLCFVMLFTLVACSSELEGPASTGNTATDGTTTATGEEVNTALSIEGFCTGYARADITPKTPVPLGGWPSATNRFSDKILDNVYATVVAVSNNGVTALFITVDLLSVTKTLYQQTVSLIEEQTGVNPDYIFLSATHTHSAPEQSVGDGSISVWKKLFYENVTEAAKKAVAELDRTEVFIGKTKTDGLNFVRRYLLADGTYAFLTHAGSGAATVGHETEADNEMQIIKFDRKNQKDILMVNWQCHPTQAGGETKTDISADYIGAFRKKAEEETGCHFAYYQGACGNVVATSRISGEMKANNYTDLGQQLATTLSLALGNLEKANGGDIKAIRTSVTADVNHSRDADAGKAAEIVTAHNAGNSKNVKALCEQYGFENSTDAIKVVERASMKAVEDIGIGAISIGDIAFIAAPYEMFDTNGMEVKSGSPFKMTFICEQSNDSVSYIPSAFAFPHGLYEVCMCRYVAGTGEKLVEGFLSMLNSLK